MSNVRLKEMKNALHELHDRYALSDGRLKEISTQSREDVGIGGEYVYGIPIVTTDFVF